MVANRTREMRPSGMTRGVAALEDKIVQAAVVAILSCLQPLINHPTDHTIRDSSLEGESAESNRSILRCRYLTPYAVFGS
jgi:hypothetical protein